MYEYLIIQLIIDTIQKNMKSPIKKFFVILLCILSAATCLALMTACNATSSTQHFSAKAATCVERGNIEYWLKDGRYYSDEGCTHEISQAETVINAKGHDFENGSYVSTDLSQHWTVCARAGCNETSAKADHVYINGMCECGRAESQSDTSQHFEAKAADCVNDGNIEYWVKGGKYYSDEACMHEIEKSETVINAKGHDFENGPYISTDLSQHWKICARTGCYETSAKEDHFYIDGICECGSVESKVDAPRHFEAKDADCIHDGNIEYWVKDGRYYSDETCTHEISQSSTVRPKTGIHTPASDYTGEEDKHYRLCSVCGQPAEAKANHTFVDGACSVCGKCNGFDKAQLIVSSADLATRTDTASSVIVTVNGYGSEDSSIKFTYNISGLTVGEAYVITYGITSNVSDLIAFETYGDNKNDDNKVVLMGGAHVITAYFVVREEGDVVAVLKLGGLNHGSRLEFTEITCKRIVGGFAVSDYNVWNFTSVNAPKKDNGDGTFNVSGTGDGTDWHLKVEQRLNLKLGTTYDMLFVVKVKNAINESKNLRFDVDGNAAAFIDENNLFWYDRGNGATVAVRFRFTAIKDVVNHYSCLDIGELTDASNPIDIDFLCIDLIEVAKGIAFPSDPNVQENSYSYSQFFLPEKDWGYQGYVGDTMPYYENGKYYVYYLKDGGDSRNHSVYLATTRDFVTWEEYPNAVLVSGDNNAQDSWIGTGSVVKVGTKYYFFYTGHNDAKEYHETVMVAESTNLTGFVKKSGWQITPHSSLGQKNDFRDPQAYYDSVTDTITLTVTASQGGVARIVKYSLKGDLTNVSYDGIIFTNPVNDTVNCFNLECSDTFRIGNKWYLTFSAQDDTLWYTSSDTQYGPYAKPKRLDGKIFYAAKHVSDGNNTYMVGWVRRVDSAKPYDNVDGWAGNMLVQKVISDGNGGICLAPVDAYLQNSVESTLLCGKTLTVQSGDRVGAFMCTERYVVTGEFTYGGGGTFGFAFDYDGTDGKYKLISFSPARQTLGLAFDNGATSITEVAVSIVPNRKYSFTYIQEGSVGIMYLNGHIALTVRIYGASGKAVRLFADNNTVVFENLKQSVYRR